MILTFDLWAWSITYNNGVFFLSLPIWLNQNWLQTVPSWNCKNLKRHTNQKQEDILFIHRFMSLGALYLSCTHWCMPWGEGHFDMLEEPGITPLIYRLVNYQLYILRYSILLLLCHGVHRWMLKERESLNPWHHSPFFMHPPGILWVHWGCSWVLCGRSPPCETLQTLVLIAPHVGN